MIGQSQVTEPLMTALRTNRVNHAYLFSGPRGCGKTTSARILARCLNCAQGPTDTPCGTCASCAELSREGQGSLDVVEIDAASHNGVDDARDLRERAIFAPARDRFKIFILDEAHMVTPQGFNALLKIVEEPPEHVKFIFATTEPDKVIGTIRSRTHHYPFRLVPPAQMLDYTQELSEREGVSVAAGVLPLVVRAGGGSVRDTLSLLDQLMAGSEDDALDYERAVALLGYTHGALLDEVIDAVAENDTAEAFAAIDRVVQTGQDPRRFVEDLLERLRDLILVAATGGAASSVLRGVSQDELDRMAGQSRALGLVKLSRIADIVNGALTEMAGATSPRLHLELMIARSLIHGIGADVTSVPSVSPEARQGPETRLNTVGAHDVPTGAPAPESRPLTHVAAPPSSPVADEHGVVTLQRLKDAWPEILEAVRKAKMTAWLVAYTAQVRALNGEVLTLSFPSHHDVDSFKMPGTAGQPGVSEYLRQAIQEVLGLRVKYIARVEPRAAAPEPERAAAESPAPDQASHSRATVSRSDVDGWATVQIPDDPSPAGPPPAESTAPARPEADRFEPTTESDPAALQRPSGISQPSADAATNTAADASAPDEEPPEDDMPIEEPPLPDAWAAVTPPGASFAPESAADGHPASASPGLERSGPVSRPTTRNTRPSTSDGRQRYGEAVVREILGAQFIEEQPHTPRGPRTV